MLLVVFDNIMFGYSSGSRGKDTRSAATRKDEKRFRFFFINRTTWRLHDTINAGPWVERNIKHVISIIYVYCYNTSAAAERSFSTLTAHE